MVYANEVTDIVDRMMKVNIFPSSEKLAMLRDKEILDPNLIMDARHRILREDLSISPTKHSVLAETRRLLTEEESRQLYIKKQQRFLEQELQKFQRELDKSRVTLSKPYVCRKRSFVPSDDEDFWRTSRRIKNKMTFEEKMERHDTGENIIDTFRKKSATEVDDSSMKMLDMNDTRETECEVSCIGNIKVTIRDKPNFDSQTQYLSLLRKCFDAFKQNVKEKERLRDIKMKIQQNLISRMTRKYFDIWRAYTKTTDTAQRQTELLSEEQRIEKFINTITERQNELTKAQDVKVRDNNLVVKKTSNTEIRKRNTYAKPINVESPAQSRLCAQRQIIEKQRAKLIEQSKIIEELKLNQAQKEIFRATKDTVDMAKETLAHCGQKTRRTLILLMQQNGYRDESLTVRQRSQDPPKFLLRMEARAEARRERIKLAEESRRKRLQEKERKEEAARIEEEQKKRRLQREALTQARRLWKEQERKRQNEIEKLKRLNDMADEFYRKYLLRRYGIEPLMGFVERKKSNIEKIDNRYKENLTRNVFIAWRRETEIRCKIVTEFAETFYNRSLMVKTFREWKQMTKEGNVKYQVAIDFYDMKLLDRYFKSWQIITLELKVQYECKEKLASNHYKSKLKLRYFFTWKKYLTIAVDIAESEKRKDKLRQLVQTVIPDFDPRQRGVALED
ncbi:golgin subfamily A member 6-like protein 26 [Hylaeus anthracinus]|uniref:golgin subfamily A member 6-like protein 26 n=1 Tax=Hylaeus anthracinus TaxID=313031 RepID=UPI0023BA06B5|nr:golgin subfamily A member 6-like protein 26 [Hylaeus anthracinus]